MQTPISRRRRWWILAVVVAGQFMFVVDAFIVNVAIPSIRADLRASGGAMDAVIAIYQLSYAALVITGGRLGDMAGRKRLFLIGLLGFTAASVDCGFATSAETLIVGRLMQGAAAALMAPQVLATIHTLFPDQTRGRAFAVFGVALGLGGATGLWLGGWLIHLDIAGMGWRSVFFVNGPIGVAIAAAAAALMPADAGCRDSDLDLSGAAMLFVALLCLVGPVLAARELHYAWWLWGIEAFGAATLAAFARLERRIQQAGRTPLIAPDLLDDKRFVLGLAATACFFIANMSVYLVITLFLQNGLGWSALDAGSTVVPVALAFVVASRHGARRAAAIGLRALIEGCLLEAAGLLAVTLVVAEGLSRIPLILALGVFGYGQGLVMAPLFGAVLMTVRQARAGLGAGMLTTVQQTANGAGVALIGGLYFAVQPIIGDAGALLVCLLDAVLALLASTVFLACMSRIAGRALA